MLDVCCGTAGPGSVIARELGCRYLGVDFSARAIALARERGRRLRGAFAVAACRRSRAGPFDVVLLLETMLAFADKAALVRAVAAALRPGGRFAFTLEEGAPLTVAERAAMPDADTVWLTPSTTWWGRWSGPGSPSRGSRTTGRAHRAQARRWWTRSPRTTRRSPRRSAGAALDDLLAAHRLWVGGWMMGACARSRLVANRVHVAAYPPGG